MSLAPPPSSPSGSFGAPTSPSPGPATSYEEPRPASALPLILGLFALASSIGIGLLDFLAISPFTYNMANVVGYVLTPFAVFFCLAWDSASQRKGSQNPWFDIRPGYSSTLRIASVAALVVATFHIIELGRVLGEWAVQSGLV